MKTLLIPLLLFLLCFDGISQEQLNKTEVINKINQVRKSIDFNDLNKNNSLDSAVTKINKLNKLEKKEKFTKDEIREILREYDNCDYQVEYVKIKIKNLDDLNINNIKNKYPDFYSILSDKSFNNIGLNTMKSFNGYTVDLIATKHYIDLDKSFKVVVQELPGKGWEKRYLKIDGSSSINNITYQAFKDETLTDDEITKGNVKLLDNKFSIRIKIQPELGALIIKDSENNIVALKKINYWRYRNEN